MKGFAWSGGGRGITRVDVSADGGRTWTVADIVEQAPDDTPSMSRSWGWTLWRADVPLPADAGASVELVCKALDAGCNTQPENAAAIWNYRGVVNNAWHRVPLHLE